MPFKSSQQRRFLYAQHPDIAKRWEKETPKKKLPKYVDEMPYLNVNKAVAGHKFGTVDLRIERYPISQQEKIRLTKAFDVEGVVGQLDGVWFRFGPGDKIERLAPGHERAFANLPNGWEKFMLDTSTMPEMKQVFSMIRRS